MGVGGSMIEVNWASFADPFHAMVSAAFDRFPVLNSNCAWSSHVDDRHCCVHDCGAHYRHADALLTGWLSAATVKILPIKESVDETVSS